MLCYTQFDYFNRCVKLNSVLAVNFVFFLRFYERRNKFRYQSKSKNGILKRDISSCVIEKFNGYNLLKFSEDVKKLLPLDIVYEPVQDKHEPIYCFFTPKIHLAYQIIYDKMVQGKKVSFSCSTAKYVHIAVIFLLNLKKKMQKHILCCDGQGDLDICHSFVQKKSLTCS